MNARRHSRPFRAQIYCLGKVYYLGSYDLAETAAAAYDYVARRTEPWADRGRRFNYPLEMELPFTVSERKEIEQYADEILTELRKVSPGREQIHDRKMKAGAEINEIFPLEHVVQFEEAIRRHRETLEVMELHYKLMLSHRDAAAGALTEAKATIQFHKMQAQEWHAKNEQLRLQLELLEHGKAMENVKITFTPVSAGLTKPAEELPEVTGTLAAVETPASEIPQR